MRTIIVEGLSDQQRTEELQKTLEQYGYRVPTEKFFEIMTSVGLGNIVSGLRERKEATVGPLTKPNMVTYGVRRLNGECAFFISILRTTSEGIPENRMIIETEEEFNSWLNNFRDALTSGLHVPMIGKKVPSMHLNTQYMELSGLFLKMEKLLDKMQKAYCKLPNDDKRMNPLLLDLEVAFMAGVFKIGEIHGRKVSTPIPGQDDVSFLLGFEDTPFEKRPRLEDCCSCSHFRMFKPQPEWCTSKKERVNPFGHCKNFTFSKHLNRRGAPTHFDKEICKEQAETYAKGVKDAGVTYLE